MLNKQKLIESLYKRTLLERSESKQVVEEVFKILKDALLREEEIYIVGFGKFILEMQKSRPVRNPRTMEDMMLKPFKKIKFKPATLIAKELKKRGSSDDD